jgi:hypothetical protein
MDERYAMLFGLLLLLQQQSMMTTSYRSFSSALRCFNVVLAAIG